MNGVAVEERGGRFRVVRTLPGGSIVTLGIFARPGEAIAYATARVLELDDEEER